MTRLWHFFALQLESRFSRGRNHCRLRPRPAPKSRSGNDSQAIWDTGSIVPRTPVAGLETARRFDPGQFDSRDRPPSPGEFARGIRSGQTEGTIPAGRTGKGVMTASFPAHWHIFAIVWLVLAVRLWRHGQCRLTSDAERKVCKSAFQREQTTDLHAHFWKPSPRLPACFEGESASARVLDRGLTTPAQDPLPDLSRSNGTSDRCAPFPRSKTRRDSTFPREVPGGPLALFSCFSLRVSGTLRRPHLPPVSRTFAFAGIDNLHL